MKMYRFDREVGREIHAFGSVNVVLSRVVRVVEETHIGCLHLEAGGVIGYHQAACRQLLLVVQGNGWVRAGEEQEVAVAPGHAVFWESGEWHETRTDEGLVAIVIESENIEPETFMQEVEVGL